jgi:hypothetical protein
VKFTDLHVEHHIPPFWERIDSIREELILSLWPHGKPFRDASVMAASELLENAVKYSGSGPNTDIAFRLIADRDRIRMETVNPLPFPEAYETLKAHIDQIQTGDRKKMYIQRLIYLMKNPGVSSTGLGLYRIAYEGGFELSCWEKVENLVVVCAERRIRETDTEGCDGSF